MRIEQIDKVVGAGPWIGDDYESDSIKNHPQSLGSAVRRVAILPAISQNKSNNHNIYHGYTWRDPLNSLPLPKRHYDSNS